MALPGLNDIPKIFKQIGIIEKRLEKFAKSNGKAVVNATVRPVIASVVALKKWVLTQFAEVWKFVKDLAKQVRDLTARVVDLESKVRALNQLGGQAGLIATHEPRLKKIEGMDRITDTKLERAAGKTAKLEAEVRELKETVKMLKKHVQDIERK